MNQVSNLRVDEGVEFPARSESLSTIRSHPDNGWRSFPSDLSYCVKRKLILTLNDADLLAQYASDAL